jgi:pyruvate dehydrogenase E2 component (dihydrolipoamide acetyltransferase)
MQQGTAPVEQQFAQARRQQAPPAPAAPQPEAAGHPGESLRASPLARRIADDKGVDLRQLQGSGPNGRIVERDVLAFLEQGPTVAVPTPRPPAIAPGPAAEPKPLAPVLLTGQKQVVPMSKMRAAIAVALQRSKQLVPHFYEKIDIDMEAAAALRQRINQRLEKENVRLSIADLITKAVASCLLQYPTLNARFNAEKNEITQYGDVNMGIAVAIPEGLIVPVLRGANQMGLKEIRLRSLDLIERARAQRLRREEQTEATFTISSLGSYGIPEFSAIINPPEVGILAVGSAEKRPVVQGDQIAVRSMMTVTLSVDHRVVDGATAAEFLTALKATLEEPGMMLV